MGFSFDGYEIDFRPLIDCQIWHPSNSRHEDAKALLDTGATDCTVRSTLADKLELEIGEPVHISNVGSSGLKPTTRIDLLLFGFNDSQKPVKYAVTQARSFIDEFDPVADIIIGMNVLRLFLLTIDHGRPNLTVP